MREQPQRLPVKKYFLVLSIGLLTVLPFTFVQGRDPLLEPVFVAQPLGSGSTSIPLAFATAIQGGGSSTSILFTQGVLRTFFGAITAFATFTSSSGQVIETQSTELRSHSTRSITFTGGQSLEAGQISLRGLDPQTGVPVELEDSQIAVTAIIDLTIPGAGNSVPPIGLPPSPPCSHPVVSLLRNEEFDTGLALSSRNQDTTGCRWTVYSGEAGTEVGNGETSIPPFGQFQFFPLNHPAVSLPGDGSSFSGNIQFDCSEPLNAVSLFQRLDDGAIFFNSPGCFD
jgi:hypothetical protein